MKNSLEHIKHTMPPIVDKDCKVLINGSILSPKSREYECYYGHPQNKFWKIICGLWSEEDPKTPSLRHKFALQHHIALWNVIDECDIVGASDSSIKNVIPNDMNKIMNGANIQAIFNLGRKANDLFEKYCVQELNSSVPHYYLPSTSPANAAMKFEEISAQFRIIRDIIDKSNH